MVAALIPYTWFLTSRLQEQFAVPLQGTHQFRLKGFQPPAAHPVAGLPDRLQSRYRLLAVLLGRPAFLAAPRAGLDRNARTKALR